MLLAIAGMDARDRHSLERAGLDTPAPDPAELRIVVSEDLGFAPVDDDVRAAFRPTVARCWRRPARRWSRTPRPRRRRSRAWSAIAVADARYAEAEEDEHRAELRRRRTRRRSWATASTSTPGDYVQANSRARADPPRVRRPVRAHGASALLTPTSASRRSSTGRRTREQIGGDADRAALASTGADSSTTPTWPGCRRCAVPVGLGDDRLPVSVQLLGVRGARRRRARRRRGGRAARRLRRPPPTQTSQHDPTRRARCDHASATRAPLQRRRRDPRFLRTNETPITSSRRRGSTCSASTAGCGTSTTSVLRHVRGPPPARVRADNRGRRGVHVDRGHLQPPAARPRGPSRGSPRTDPGGKVAFVMFDEETEALAAELGLEIVHPPAALRERLDSKIVTTAARQRGRRARACPTCSAAPRLRRAARARRRARPRRRPRRSDAVRRLRQDDVLHPRASATGTGTPTTSSARSSR